jgi:hypothetical protein
VLLEVCAYCINDNESVRLCKLPHLLWQLILSLLLLLPCKLALLLLLLLLLLLQAVACC